MEGYLGQIIMFAGNFAPRGWAFCDGTILSINEYPGLYSILGTNYGGNGTTNFQLPDLRAKVPLCEGTSPSGNIYQLGRRGGYEYITIAEDNLPSHSHAIDSSGGGSGGSSTADLKVYNGVGDTSNPAEATSIASKVVDGMKSFSLLSKNTSPSSISGAVTGIQGGGSVPPETEVTGGGEALYNMQPFQVVNYIICVDGLYPSRN